MSKQAEPVPVESTVPVESSRQPAGRTDLIGGLALLAISTFMLYHSDRGPDWTFPVALAWVLVIIGAWLAVLGLVRLRATAGARQEAGAAVRPKRDPIIAVFAAIAVVYGLLIEPVGFWPSSAALIFGCGVLLQGERPTRRSLVTLVVLALGVCLVGYVVLQEFLRIPLPNGLLDPLLP